MRKRLAFLLFLLPVAGWQSADAQKTHQETYRSHGSSYEARVPVFVYNAKGAPGLDYFTDNYKLAAWLWR